MTSPLSGTVPFHWTRLSGMRAHASVQAMCDDPLNVVFILSGSTRDVLASEFGWGPCYAGPTVVAAARTAAQGATHWDRGSWPARGLGCSVACGTFRCVLSCVGTVHRPVPTMPARLMRAESTHATRPMPVHCTAHPSQPWAVQHCAWAWTRSRVRLLYQVGCRGPPQGTRIQESR